VEERTKNYNKYWLHLEKRIPPPPFIFFSLQMRNNIIHKKWGISGLWNECGVLCVWEPGEIYNPYTKGDSNKCRAWESYTSLPAVFHRLQRCFCRLRSPKYFKDSLLCYCNEDICKMRELYIIPELSQSELISYTLRWITFFYICFPLLV